MKTLNTLKSSSFPVHAPADFDPLIRRLARARIVMLGEATHGTHEFYEVRRIISEWLIARHGFRFIAVEGDWPACSALDRTLQGTGAPAPREALEAFRRWPTWMWANTDVIRLAEWLVTHNRRLGPGLPKIHFHGLDVYSLF